MAIPQNFTTVTPTLKDLLNVFRDQILIEFNAHHIGTIESFNPIDQTATVTINYVKTQFVMDPITQQYNPLPIPYPLLAQAPVIVLGGGQTALTFPITPGDECLVLFNDRDIDNWFAGSLATPVNTPRLHSFSDAIILVGLRSLLHSLTNYDAIRSVIRGGVVPGTMTAVGVNPVTSKVLVTNTYPANAVTLNTLMQQLITDLQTLILALTTNAPSFIAVTGATGSPSPLNPAIVTALTAVSTSLTTLATSIGALLE